MFSCEKSLFVNEKNFWKIHRITFMQYTILRNSGINPRNKQQNFQKNSSFFKSGSGEIYLKLPDADNEPNSSKKQLCNIETVNFSKKLFKQPESASTHCLLYNIARLMQKTSHLCVNFAISCAPGYQTVKLAGRYYFFEEKTGFMSILMRFKLVITGFKGYITFDYL